MHLYCRTTIYGPCLLAPIAYKHVFSSSFSSIAKWRSSVQRGPAAVTNADMMIKVSQNQDSTWCQEVERIDENTTTLGFPYLKYITKTNQVTENDALNWLYPNGINSYQETILYSNNESVDKWNAIVQRMNRGTEYKVMLRDSFKEVDDPNGHLKKMLTKAVLNKFRKNGVPNH